MAKYIDSGNGNPNHTIEYWLDTNFVNGIQGFRGQFGYFAFSALEPYIPTIEQLLLKSLPVHIVLGSNDGSLLATDLSNTLSLLKGHISGHLTVVA